MYYKFDPNQSVSVEKPYARTITPVMMAEAAGCPAEFSVHITEWEPGSQVDDHFHDDYTEAMYCLAGHGTAAIDGVEYDFCPHSMIVASPKERHWIKNTGDTKLQVLCIYSPAMTQRSLQQRAEEAVAQWRKENPSCEA